MARRESGPRLLHFSFTPLHYRFVRFLTDSLHAHEFESVSYTRIILLPVSLTFLTTTLFAHHLESEGR